MWLWIALGIVVSIGFVAFLGAPYVPSKRKDIDRAFTELYQLDHSDLLIDIGAGDGVVLREASKRGAHAIGYEIHPVLVAIAKLLSRSDDKVMVVLANFWAVEMPANTTVVYTFGDGRDIAKMYRKVQQEATRIGRELSFISYAFEVPGVKLHKSIGAHHLYKVKPLQSTTEAV